MSPYSVLGISWYVSDHAAPTRKFRSRIRHYYSQKKINEGLYVRDELMVTSDNLPDWGKILAKLNIPPEGTFQLSESVCCPAKADRHSEDRR